MPYFVNKTLIIAYFKNNVVHSHVFADNPDQVRSEQASFVKILQNCGDLTTPRMYLPASFPKPDPGKPPPPKTDVLFHFPLLQPISPYFCLPIGAISGDFQLRKPPLFPSFPLLQPISLNGDYPTRQFDLKPDTTVQADRARIVPA